MERSISQKLERRQSVAMQQRATNEPAGSKCRNCDAQMYGRFCHVCGQDIYAGRKGVAGNIAANFLDNIYAIDAQTFNTVKLLLFYPGKLTLEYYKGHIVRYVRPYKLFWSISIIFFLSLSYLSDGGNPNVAIEKFSITIDDDSVPPPQEKNFQEQHPGVTAERLSNIFWSYAPYALLLLVPLFSMLMFVFFHRKMPYSFNTIFALHFHAFLYLFLGIINVVYHFWASALLTYTIIVPFIYLMVAVRVFYKSKLISTFFKLLLIVAIYFVIIALFLVIFLVFVAYKASGETWSEFFNSIIS